MKRITVFCGSSPGADSVYMKEAILLGKTLAARNLELVYGGACIGLMGAVADSVLSEGGKVTGVMPLFMGTKEVIHEGLTEMILVNSMHERKTKMNELCDGVIALPGGFGTLEELFEMLTWAQLGLHKKPIGILNTAGYYDKLIDMIETMLDKGFLKEVYRKMLLTSASVENLLDQMSGYVAPEVPQWITDDRT